MRYRGLSQAVVHADTSHESGPADCFSFTNEQIRGVPAFQIHSTSPQLRVNGHCDLQQMQSLMQVSSWLLLMGWNWMLLIGGEARKWGWDLQLYILRVDRKEERLAGLQKSDDLAVLAAEVLTQAFGGAVWSFNSLPSPTRGRREHKYLYARLELQKTLKKKLPEPSRSSSFCNSGFSLSSKLLEHPGHCLQLVTWKWIELFWQSPFENIHHLK